MELTPKNGIGKLLFGMRRADVEKILGRPNREFTDEEQNVIWLYNSEKLRITFYEEEDFRFGYLICSHAETELYGQRIIGKDVEEIKAMLKPKGFKTWEVEEFDMTINHFNEEQWVILESEFGEIVKVEAGAIITDDDEFDWKHQ